MDKTKENKILKAFLKLMPNQFVILAFTTILMAVLTYIVIPGNYERKTIDINGVTQSVVVAGTFEESDNSKPVDLLSLLTAPYRGMIAAASIVFFLFIVYPSFYLLIKTEALNGFISLLIKILGNRGWIIIPSFTLLFGLLTSTILAGPEFYGFIPLFAGITIALGYDAFVGFCIVVLGSFIGFTAAITNPFNIITAQTIAEIPIYSDVLLRFIIFILHMSITIFWIMKYASMVKKNPELSIVKGLKLEVFSIDKNNMGEYKITIRHILVLITFITSMIILFYGVIAYKWAMMQMAGIFFGMGIISAIIMGFSPNKIADEFLFGMKNSVVTAMISGVSRGILVVLEDGDIIDSIMNGIVSVLYTLPTWLTAVGMLIAQTIINFFIPSATGQAMTTMPIMIGLSDLLNISRELTVLVFQFGDGLSNLLWPTSATAVVCALIGIPIQKWWKFYFPLFLVLLLLESAIVIFLSIINFW